MKLLLATPAYDGGIKSEYSLSLQTTYQNLLLDKIPVNTYSLSNESLIQRARNKIANFMLQKDYTHLLFIDSDIGWEYTDVRRLLLSDKMIVGGTYPMKTLPICLNFNPLKEHLSEFGHVKGVKEFEAFKQKYADENGEVEVMHIPTGFMLIRREVFEILKDKVDTYYSTDYHTQKTNIAYDFFPAKVHNNILESEDWGFCRQAKESGISIWLNMNIITTHTGSFVFDARKYANLTF